MAATDDVVATARGTILTVTDDKEIDAGAGDCRVTPDPDALTVSDELSDITGCALKKLRLVTTDFELLEGKNFPDP
jgi:hypothetical protein